MSRIAPKPIIAQVVQTWRLAAGMSFTLVRDIEGAVWIVESCPAGTRFWTPEQAAQLSQGRHTGTAIRTACRRAEEITAILPVVAEAPALDYTLTDTVKKMLEASDREPLPSVRSLRPLTKPCLSV